MAEPAAKLESVSLRYGRHVALAEVTTSLPQGAIVGLTGRNGAGKSSLLRALVGREPGHTGAIRVGGLPVRRLGRALGLAHLSGDDWPYAADQNLRSMLGALRRTRPGFDAARAAELLEAFGVPLAGFKRNLSRGQFSAAQSALGLATRAPLTLLDEPQLGLDAPSRERLAALIVQEQADWPRTIVISTHLIDETAPLFERLLVLDAGRLVADDDVDVLLGRYLRVQADSATLEILPHLGAIERLGGRASAVVPADAVPRELVDRAHPLTLQALASVLPLDRKDH